MHHCLHEVNASSEFGIYTAPILVSWEALHYKSKLTNLPIIWKECITLWKHLFICCVEVGKEDWIPLPFPLHIPLLCVEGERRKLGLASYVPSFCFTVANFTQLQYFIAVIPVPCCTWSFLLTWWNSCLALPGAEPSWSNRYHQY